MSRLPRLTIITPSYNRGRYIERTIRSVIDQGYPDLEHIVVDGGSSDDTLETLLRYDQWLRWRSERDRGQADALNKGLRMATGDVIALINAGDTYEPGALLEVGRLFATHPDVPWLTGRCRTTDLSGNEIRRPITHYKNAWLRLGSFRVLNVSNFIAQPATFWRRSVVQTIGPFDEGLRYAMDYDYHLRVWSRFDPLVVNQYLANLRVHPESKASSANARFDTDLAIVRRHTSSRVLLSMHAAHNAAAVATYRLLDAPLGRFDCGFFRQPVTKPTLVVTGGSGFIGTNLVEHFAGRGWRVRNLDLAPPRNPAHERYWTAVDLLDRELLTAELGALRPKAVLHFAARTDLDERAGLGGYRANTDGVANVIQAVRAVRSVERVIFASTQLVATPDSPPNGERDYRPTTTYGRSKALGEMIVRAADIAPAWTIVRPTSIWGPWCATPFREFFTAVARGRYVQPSGVSVRKQWGYVGNVCHQLERLLAAEPADVKGRTFYLSDYDAVDLHDFANRVRGALGRPPVRLVPAPLLRLGAVVGDVAQRLGWERPPLTSFRYQNLLRNERQELEPLRRLTGPLPFTVDEGIGLTVGWLGQLEPALAA